MFHRPTVAPVVQWIEHWSPEPLFQFPCNWGFHHEGSGIKTKAQLASAIQRGATLPSSTWLNSANLKADERKYVFDAKNITPKLHLGAGGRERADAGFPYYHDNPRKILRYMARIARIGLIARIGFCPIADLRALGETAYVR